MLRARILWIPLLILALSIGATACTGGDTEKGAIILIEQDWDGQIITTEVAKLILEREMGYEVELKFAPADSQAMFQGLEDGDMHFACCNWPDFSAGFVADYIDERGTVERVGPTGILGSNGWFTPTYVTDGDADKGIEAVAPDLVSWEQLNQYKDVFSTSATGSKGRILDFTPAWDYNNEERVESLGLDYEVIYTGSEAATFAEMDSYYGRGEPILLVMWAPHWSHTKYELTEIELPPYTQECWDSDRHDCGWVQSNVAKIAWPGLKDEFPDAYQMLQNFTITNEQQNEMVFAKTESDKTVTEAVSDWLAENEDVWRPWIP